MKNTLWLCFSLLLAACGQNPAPQNTEAATKQSTLPKPAGEDIIDTTIKITKNPCLTAKPVEKVWKNEANEFVAKLTTECLNDYAIKDTFEHHDGTLEVVSSSNYKYTVDLALQGSGAKQYTITKNVFVDSLPKTYFNECILVNMDIISFDAETVSVQIQGYFGVPDTDDVIGANFRVYYTEGVKFEGFSSEDYDDI